jgi:hypothetical protein
MVGTVIFEIVFCSYLNLSVLDQDLLSAAIGVYTMCVAQLKKHAGNELGLTNRLDEVSFETGGFLVQTL